MNDVTIGCDMTFAFGGTLVAITAGVREVYLLTSNGALTTLALPDEGPMTPWRVIGMGNEVLRVTRGALTAKCDFYILRRMS